MIKTLRFLLPTILTGLIATGSASFFVDALALTDAPASERNLLPVGVFDDGAYNTQAPGLIEVTMVRAKDGDTVVVNDGQENLTVRIIGVDTPESVHSDSSRNCEEGVIASDYTKAHLPAGMPVYLEYDEDRQDPYGRTLAYVWLSDNVDTSDYADFCKYNYGAILLQNTYCRAVYYAPNGKYKSWYKKLEDQYQDHMTAAA